MRPDLIIAAHGTTSAAGRVVIEDCAARAADLLQVSARVGYVDVCEPTLSEVLATTGTTPVVVPLFLASGYHVRHDVPAAVAESGGAHVTPALGSAPAVIEALAARLREALGGETVRDAVNGIVLASAGSTQEHARAEVARVAELLADRVGVPVSAGYLSGPGASLADACATHRGSGRTRVGVATHLLAPGVFLERARQQGRQLAVVAVADELGSHPAISTLLAARYTSALTGAAGDGRL